jgi:predicted kinase
MAKMDHRLAIVVCGPPASGKSTLGAALAETLPAVLIDQDIATAPLVGVVASLIDVYDLEDPRLATATRRARYETITGIAENNLRVGNAVVLVAPFTKERRDRAAWDELSQRLQEAGGTVTMLWLSLEPEQILQRLRARAVERDAEKLKDTQGFLDRLDLAPPVGPHLPIPAAGPVDHIVPSIVRHLRSSAQLAIDGKADNNAV